MENIILNEEQEKAKELIIDWFKNNSQNKLIFTLSGYAGTGKTFLINYILKVLEMKPYEVAYIAPTGKAACVLIQRGAFQASTIHKLIYNRVKIEYETEVNGKKIKSSRFEFVKKPSIPNYKLIIIDEISMVEKKILEDVLSFGIPLLCCGDEGQLPPIFESNGLLDHPDARLTKIMRQAEGNAILKIAEMARQNIPIPLGNYGNVIVTRKNLLKEEQIKKLMLKSDQILCETNRTRVSLNQQMKSFLNFEKNKLNENEKIICLLNNWGTYMDDEMNFFLVNGVIGFVKSFEETNKTEIGKLTFQADFLNDECTGLLYDKNVFANNEFKYDFNTYIYILEDGTIEVKEPFKKKTKEETKEQYMSRLSEYMKLKNKIISTEQLNFFDTAYAITVWKSQGSEWNNVLFFEENSNPRYKNKLLYTAITRAKKNLVIIK